MVSTSQKISCPLAIINCLKPASHSIPIMASTSRRVALIKKLFPLDRKSFSTSGMKGLVKNAFPIYDKVASTLKNLKISEKTGDR